jgi:hypothetical protein
MTPIQREELDWEIEHMERVEKWRPRNRWDADAKFHRLIDKIVPWLCASIAVPIAIIIGSEILFHAWAFFHG